MASKFRESNTNIEVNLFYVIIMRPKLGWSANGAIAQLQKFLCATGNSTRYLEKWRQSHWSNFIVFLTSANYVFVCFADGDYLSAMLQ